MHKIIHIKGDPDCPSSTGTNGYHHTSNSHKRSATGASSLRNGTHRGENGQSYHAVHTNDSDTEDEADITPLRAPSRTRTNKRKGTAWKNGLANVLSFLIPIVFPTVHMYIFTYLWGHMKTPVNTQHCTCSCWDTIFKGPYETGIAGYKHVYFNSDGNTLKMWIITVIGVLFLYEAFKRLFLLLLNKKLRWTMGLLFLSSLHSHYYAWWGHWNYWNDDFYNMWYHQVFFTVTELISSIMVLNYLDLRRAIEPIPMLIISSIAVFHTLCSGWDQFVFTVVEGQGQLHQILRDVTLMTTDMLHAGLSLYEVRGHAHKKGMSLFSVLFQRTHLLVVLIMTATMYAVVLLFP